MYFFEENKGNTALYETLFEIAFGNHALPHNLQISH